MSAPSQASRSAPGSAQPGRPARRHIYELDVVRGLTMAGVVGVHTTSLTTPHSSVAANGVIMLLHVTRESFFMLTAFVLMYAYGKPGLNIWKFYRKRYPLVVIPYAVWTAIYQVCGQGALKHPHMEGELRRYAWNLLTGQAWYHLYFLLVTLQFYLVFPLVAWLVRATRKHHVTVLVVVCVVQIVAVTLAEFNAPGGHSVGEVLNVHRDVLLPSYPLYLVAGAVAGDHLDELRTWVASHRIDVAWVVLAAAVLAEGWYLVDVHSGTAPVTASQVFQPVMVPWSLAAVAGLFALGSWWGERAEAGHPGRLIPTLSTYSFGIFLVHPLVLRFFGVLGIIDWFRRRLPDGVVAAGFWATAMILATAFAVVASRTPASAVLTGRPMRRRTARPTAPPPAAVADPLTEGVRS